MIKTYCPMFVWLKWFSKKSPKVIRFVTVWLISWRSLNLKSKGSRFHSPSEKGHVKSQNCPNSCVENINSGMSWVESNPVGFSWGKSIPANWKCLKYVKLNGGRGGWAWHIIVQLILVSLPKKIGRNSRNDSKDSSCFCWFNASRPKKTGVFLYFLFKKILWIWKTYVTVTLSPAIIEVEHGSL